MKLLVCDNCSKEFLRKNSRVYNNKHFFCSHECRNNYYKDKTPRTTCSYCTKTFYLIPSQAKRSEEHFCSRRCKALFLNNKQYPEDFKLCTCIACQKKFKRTSKKKRKYCPDCLKERLSLLRIQKESIPEPKQKTCVLCNKTLNSPEFFYKNERKCISCYRKEISERWKQKKQILISLLGGKCQHCGNNDPHVSIYDFHHVDPKTKTFSICANRNKRMEELMEETKKCILLCSNCHRKLHWGTEEENI